MKSFKLAMAALLCLSASLPALALKTGNYSQYYKNLPIELKQVKSFSIPNREVSIEDFGGVADGVTLNTEAFAKAMAHLASKGGGRLNVPAGIWYTGPIQFEDNIELHLDRGALVLFSRNRADYPNVNSFWEGLPTHRCMSPLSARNKHNIAITGEGAFNGNGQYWRPVKRMKMTDGQWKALLKTGVTNEKGDTWFPSEQARAAYYDADLQKRCHKGDPDALAAAHDFLRPALVSFMECKNVLFQDVTFENSPSWNVHPFLCENLIVDNVNIKNPWYAQNGDGIDIECCTNVLLINSSFDVGDDAICIKAGKDKPGREIGVPCSNVLIDGCTVYHGHGGFVIGSEMSSGCKDIVAKNCLFLGTDVGLRFKSTRGRGGVVENVYIDGINMSNIPGEAITMDLYYGVKAGAPVPPVTEETPLFKDIYMKNLTCSSSGRAAHIFGLPEMPFKNIVIENSRIRADKGIDLNYIDGLTLKDVVIDTPDQEITIGEGVANVTRQ